MSKNNYFVHAQALNESNNIGNDTRIWAFTHILPQAKIGSHCNICDHVFIENDVLIGDRVTIKCGVQVWDGVTLEDDVFIGPNVTFTNDIFPRSDIHLQENLLTVIKQGASIGANATILPGITIGINAMIGAGAVVTRSIPPKAIVVGNPARIIGYVDTKSSDIKDNKDLQLSNVVKMAKSSVAGVTLHNQVEASDIRGSLSVGEFERDIPFHVLRYFLVYDVPTAETRGEHAHFKCHQFLIAVKGSVHVVADDGVHREEFLLDTPNIGLHLPPMTWGIQYSYSSDSVLLVFASEYYDSEDYIRSYDQFIELINQGKGIT